MPKFKGDTRERLSSEYPDNESLIKEMTERFENKDSPKGVEIFVRILRRAEALGRSGHELTVRSE